MNLNYSKITLTIRVEASLYLPLLKKKTMCFDSIYLPAKSPE